MKKKTWNTSAIAQCQDCEWRCEEFEKAHSMGAMHAEQHNHLVIVETVSVTYYNYLIGDVK